MENNNLIDLENKIKAFFATTLEDMNVKLSADMEMIDQIKQDLRDFIYLFKEFHNEVLASLPKPAEKNRSRTPNKITATAKKPGMAKTTRENTSRSKTPVGKITSNTLNKTSVNIQSKPGVKNTPLKKTNKLDTQAKNLKRDLTPTPGSRKNNPLDVSQDNTKKKKNSVLVGSKPNLNGKEKEKSNISSSRLPTQTNEDKISSPEKPFTNIENTPQKEEQEKKEILNKEELTNDSKVNSEVKICFSNKASSNDLPNPTETPKVEEEVQAKPVELSKDAAINERFDSRIKNGKLFSTKSLNCLYLVANSEYVI